MVKDHSESERGRKEGNVLFNDALNTFYLRLYGVGHMVKDHSESERGRKEGNVLFNDALNTFYLRLYGVGHMVKDHSESEKGRKERFYLTTLSTHIIYGYNERGNPVPPHRLLFLISSKGSFICTIPQTG